MTAPDETAGDRFRCNDCGEPLPGPDAQCSSCAPTRIGTGGPGSTDDDRRLTQVTTQADDYARGASAEFSGPKRIGSYKVIRELGAGGMGTVLEAHDEKMNRRVALKVMSRHQGTSGKAEKRFAQEAWIAGRLDHPHLVKVYERGQWEELSYFSMELVSGGSLADVVRNMKRWGRDDRLKLTFGSADYVRWAIDKIVETARGLAYAHGHGVVHRDIKPMNLLLTKESGEVKIADFGLAIDDEATRMTSAGNVLGTLIYMAPEQILGKKELDARTDVYALGVTLFELLTLDLPYTGKTQQMYINAILTTEARRPSKLNQRVGRDLEVVIRKALEKEPRDRYASATEFADDLEAVLQHRPIRARPPKRGERLVKWAQRRPFRAALIGLLIVGAPLVAFLTDRALDQRRLARQERIEQLETEVRLMYQRDRFAELAEPASEILRLDPEHLRALHTRGISRALLADQTADASRRQRLQDEALDDVRRIIVLQPEAAWPLKLRAWILELFGRNEEAAESRRLAGERQPAELTETDLYYDGLFALETGDYALAIELLTAALARNPTSSRFLAARAVAHERQGNAIQAIQDNRLLLALDPDYLVATLSLGRLLTATGSVDEGAQYTARALEIAPQEPIVYEELANLALVRGRSAVSAGDPETAARYFGQAENHARSALTLDPATIWSRINLGASLMEQNRLLASSDAALIDEAVNYYEEAIRLLEALPGRAGEAEIAAALINSCDALIQSGNLERAVHSCSDAVNAMPEEPVAYYNLAGVFALLGRHEEAIEALEKDLELGDTDWPYLEADAWFESMRDDPRFINLLARMKQTAQ